MARAQMLLCLYGVIFLAATACGWDEKKPAAMNPMDAAFERLKGLVGEWEAAASNEHVEKGQVLLRIRLTGGGTAISETILPDTKMEMLSVYFRDGKDLVMTHYCCVGNQPRMKARAGKDANELIFEFVGGSNLDPATDPHIHGGVIRFLDGNRLHSEWDFYAGGKLQDKHSFDLVKKKS